MLKARYYGEISYIDDCLGRILDAVDARADADNTLICFFTDHGDMLGDHHAWQKESFFEASCHIPFLVSWPATAAAGRAPRRVGLPRRPVRHLIGFPSQPENLLKQIHRHSEVLP